jgi:hypothetical protein
VKIINIDNYRINGILYFGDLIRDISLWNRIEMSKDYHFPVTQYLLDIFSTPIYEENKK